MLGKHSTTEPLAAFKEFCVHLAFPVLKSFELNRYLIFLQSDWQWCFSLNKSLLFSFMPNGM
jgi:hypothetical protein